jgi:hypothetical protein
MFTDDRNAYRQLFFETWNKHLKQLPLQAVEAQLLDVILVHPEYHALLERPDQFMSQEFELEENPFFHMSLHISVREQIQMDRPTGIKMIYQNLIAAHANALDAEHKITDALAQAMFKAQVTGLPANENEYMAKLKELT